MQTLTTARTVGDALPVSLAPAIIVEEHPLVLVLFRLPPEFGPDSFSALALAIKNSHERPVPFLMRSVRSNGQSEYDTYAT
jgi:hypothetical protein